MNNSDIVKSITDSIAKALAKGDWITIGWKDRIEIDPKHLRELYAQVDFEAVKKRLVERVNDLVAEKIFNAMATEIGTDVKKILSNTELREDCRSFLREKIRKSSTALSEEAG